MKISQNTLILLLSAFTLKSFSQKQDSTKALNEVVVRGFETERKLIETAASVSVLTIKDLDRFDNTSMLPAINTVAGVRMEERSPGSYRLSIRGSSLRSPFGVRNVKVYWNDIPFTDGNGVSYLNLIDMQTVGKAEIIKGPAGSIYGAGTGGVVVLSSQSAVFSPQSSVGSSQSSVGSSQSAVINQNPESKIQNPEFRIQNSESRIQNPEPRIQNSEFNANLQFGSFNSQRRSFGWQNASEKSNSVLTYAHQQSDGYREHSSMVRDVLNYRGSFFVNEHKTLNISGLYADIQYDTPGGLTQAQLDANPRSARPSTATIAGPVAQNAGIYQKVFNLGASQEYRWNQHFSNVTAVFSSFGNLRNPFLTNYETRNEQTFGGRTRMTYKDEIKGIPINISVGGEFVRTASLINNYGNKRGVLDTLQTSDNVLAWQHFYFGQIELDLPKSFILTIGASNNHVKYDFLRLSDIPKLNKPIENWLPLSLSPRIALLKNFKDKIAIHGSISRGFSPPTITEYVTGYRSPSYFAALAPEKGLNFELGTRGAIFNQKLNFDLAIYSFQLQDVIIRSVNEAGVEVFTNAGLTQQNGMELSLNSLIINDLDNKFINRLRVFLNLTMNDYKYKDVVIDKVNFAGKRLIGMPNQFLSMGFDLSTKQGIHLNSTLNFTDKIPLNNANTFYADAYWILTARMGYRLNMRHLSADFYAGGDNLLNQIYSLGNDYNAAANRFFNPAPSRNFYFGVNLGIR
jgi:iron complex outermembrane recepter protein